MEKIIVVGSTFAVALLVLASVPTVSASDSNKISKIKELRDILEDKNDLDIPEWLEDLIYNILVFFIVAFWFLYMLYDAL